MASIEPVGPVAGVGPSAPSDWVAEFVLDLTAELDREAVRWLVLRNHEDVPDRVGHDVDIIVHPDDAARIDPLVRRVVRQGGLALLRAYAGIEHETFDVAAAPATWADEFGAGRSITVEASRG